MSGGGGDAEVKDTPEQRYAAQVAAEKWNYAQQALAPLENKYMEDVDKIDSAENSAYLRGVTNQASQQNLSKGLSQVDGQLAQGGINPNSGRFVATQGDFTEQQAAQGGETMGRAAFQQEAEKIKGLQNVVAIGSGQSTSAQNGLNDIASASAADARADETSNYNRRSANLQLLGSIAGAATSVGMNAYQSGAFNAAPAAAATPVTNGLSSFSNGYGINNGSTNGLKYGA
jgi:hypothetical protein